MEPDQGRGAPRCGTCGEPIKDGTLHTVTSGGATAAFHPTAGCCPRCAAGERPYTAPAGRVVALAAETAGLVSTWRS